MSAIPTTITRSVTLAPGESFTLPSGATVVSVTDTLDTECNLDMPAPEELGTYNFEFPINQDNEDDHPMGGIVNIDSFLINGVVVPLTFTAMNTHSTGNSLGIITWHNERTTNNSLLSSYPIKFISISADYVNGPKQDRVYVQVQMPASYLTKVQLKITSYHFLNGLYLYAF